MPVSVYKRSGDVFDKMLQLWGCMYLLKDLRRSQCLKCENHQTTNLSWHHCGKRSKAIINQLIHEGWLNIINSLKISPPPIYTICDLIWPTVFYCILLFPMKKVIDNINHVFKENKTRGGSFVFSIPFQMQLHQ